MSSEVDDVLSSLCKNMLLLNQEQQLSANGKGTSRGIGPTARSLLNAGNCGPSADDLTIVSNAMSARSGNTAPTAQCLLSLRSALFQGAEQSRSYFQVQVDQAENGGSNNGGFENDEMFNVNWPHFNISATTTPGSRSPETRASDDEAHSKSALSFQSS